MITDHIAQPTEGDAAGSVMHMVNSGLASKSGEHQLNGQEVFNVPRKQTDAKISAPGYLCGYQKDCDDKF